MFHGHGSGVRSSLIVAGAFLSLAAQQVRQSPDEVYTALRDMTLGPTRVATVKDWVWTRDAATFRFKQGKLYLFPPVLDRVTGAVFVGDGEYSLEPIAEIENVYFRRAIGKDKL